MDEIHKSKILLVDDDDSWFKIVKEIIGDKYTLLYENNGEDGFKRVKSELPDLILSDSVMMGSEYLYKALNRDKGTRDIPKIAFTANPLSRYDWNRMGFDGCILKIHFDRNELEDKIKSLLKDIVTIGNQRIDISDPFNIPLSVLNDMDFDSEEGLRERLRNILWKKYPDWIEEQFQEHETDAFVLCGEEVITPEDMSGEELEKIEKEKGKICYGFAIDTSEEIGTSEWKRTDCIDNKSEGIKRDMDTDKGIGTSEWNRTDCIIDNQSGEVTKIKTSKKNFPYYPTVPLTAGDISWNDKDMQNKGVKVTADFDTGNPDNLYFEKGGEIWNLLSKHFSNSFSWIYDGTLYTTYEQKIKIRLDDVAGNYRCSEIFARFVKTPDDKTFKNIFKKASPNREVFAGRALWTKIKFSVTLDPKDKITTIKLLD